jgi:hypothetical protein
MTACRKPFSSFFLWFQMQFTDLANLLDSDGNMQNEMMVMAFAATLLSTIPVLLGNEFDINVGLKKKRRRRKRNFNDEVDNVIDDKWREVSFYLQTLPKIIKKLQSRDPTFLGSLEDE